MLRDGARKDASTVGSKGASGESWDVAPLGDLLTW
jgi:hypothetical protein